MKLFLAVGALATLFLWPRPGLACSCVGTPSVCGAFASAEAVFVGTVSRVENQTVKGSDDKDFIASQVAYVQVDELFKGPKTAELVFRSEASSCDVRYEQGQRWLFYASYDKQGRAWRIGYCGRSTLVSGAEDDLLYLRGLPGSAQKTRISGKLWNGADEKPLMGVKVNITGEGKTLEVFTDKNGVYEVYGLPAGKYIIVPETPLNLKLRYRIMSLGPGPRDPQQRVDLKEKSCGGVDFYFTENTAIAGTVFGASGQPMHNVCVSLRSTSKPTESRSLFDCTDENGRFKIDDIGLGEYFLIANDDDVITSNQPFPLTYYPGVFEKEKATVLNIASGDKLQDFDIHVPSQRVRRTVQGKLLFSDGRPVDDGTIEFAAEEKPGQGVDRVFTRTDAEGRFKIAVLEGAKGTLMGRLYSMSRESAKCPELDKLNKAYKDLETKPITVELNRDHANIELVLPFPYCPKAKEQRE